MKKKISLLLLVFVLALSFVGCGAKKETLKYDQATLEQYSEMIIQSFSQMKPENFDGFKNASDFSLSYTLMNSGLPVSNEDFLAMVDAWQKTVSEYGAFEKHDAFEIEATDKEVTLTTEATFEKQTVDLVVVFNDKLEMTSLAAADHYTIGKILEKAGLNTLLGMGTVFAVLIFISLLIALFKYIPALEEKLSGKGKAKTEPVKAAPAPAAVTKISEPDDTQLIAVITAAIAAAEGTTSTDGFIVRSIKRRKTNKWN